MTEEAPYELDPVTLEIYDVFRRMPGEELSVEMLVTQSGYDADEVGAAMQQLLGQSLVVERGNTDTAYVLSDKAPEL